MRNGRRDGNHAEIVKAAREVPGVTVFDTADVGKGFVDIVVGYAGRTYLVEIKDGDNQPPSKTRLTQAEQKFHDEWTGHVCVVRSKAELMELLQLAVIDEMLSIGRPKP